MKNTYELKTSTFGDEYLEMTTPEGVVSFVPIDEANADYQAYLNPVEHLTEIPPQAALSTPNLP